MTVEENSTPLEKPVSEDALRRRSERPKLQKTGKPDCPKMFYIICMNKGSLTKLKQNI